MITASASVFENLVYRKIKKIVSENLDDVLTTVVGDEEASVGEKREVEEKSLEMFQRAVNECITSKRQQLYPR